MIKMLCSSYCKYFMINYIFCVSSVVIANDKQHFVVEYGFGLSYSINAARMMHDLRPAVSVVVHDLYWKERDRQRGRTDLLGFIRINVGYNIINVYI